MRYFVKTPWLFRKIWPSYLWHITTTEKVMYLSFDDGPDPLSTPFILDQLNRYGAKATFFCVGKNVMAYPSLYERIISEGHSVGNHTQHHLDGFKTKTSAYLDDVRTASRYIESDLFRPPYGKIRRNQARLIGEAMKSNNPRIVMWTVLSGDFDQSISADKCLRNVTANANKGSVIVFHDNPKAFSRLSHALPGTLAFFANKGFKFDKLKA